MKTQTSILSCSLHFVVVRASVETVARARTRQRSFVAASSVSDENRGLRSRVGSVSVWRSQGRSWGARRGGQRSAAAGLTAARGLIVPMVGRVLSSGSRGG